VVLVVLVSPVDSVPFDSLVLAQLSVASVLGWLVHELLSVAEKKIKK
jgi:hypothetical protein